MANQRAGIDLTGKTAVVTGSSSGIGRAIALELAAAGASVVVHARSNETGAREVAQTIAKGKSDATVLMADLRETGNCLRLADQAWSWRGGVDIWVNNAGTDVLTGEAAKLSFEEKLARLWQVDVRATMTLSREIGQRMKVRTSQQAASALLNMGWDQAEQGMAGDSGEMFSAVKGAVMAFTRSLAQTLAPQVRVNCLAPGWIRTSWGNATSEYWQHRACSESLMNRWGTPQDVATAALFLASPAADFINGEIIAINGGRRYGQDSP